MAAVDVLTLFTVKKSCYSQTLKTTRTKRLQLIGQELWLTAINVFFTTHRRHDSIYTNIYNLYLTKTSPPVTFKYSATSSAKNHETHRGQGAGLKGRTVTVAYRDAGFVFTVQASNKETKTDVGRQRSVRLFSCSLTETLGPSGGDRRTSPGPRFDPTGFTFWGSFQPRQVWVFQIRS